MNWLKSNKREILLFICTFSFFMIFYINVHPIVISDTDDWLYTYFHRSPFPQWKGWNPTRVLAEVFMPLISFLSVKLIMPFTGDFMLSLSIGYATIISLFLAILILMLYKHFEKRSFSKNSSLTISLFFIISIFWIFRSFNSNNTYMLWSIDACTQFYYVIPNIINCILLLWIIDDPDVTTRFFLKGKYLKKGIFICFLYFCMFSNIWSSVIPMSYIGYCLLNSLIEDLKKKRFRMGNYIKVNAVYLVIFCMWLTVQLFEAMGGRSESLGNNNTLSKTIDSFVRLLKTINIKFALTFIIVIVLGVILMVRRNNKRDIKYMITFIVAFILDATYTLLTCIKTGAKYIERPDVIFGMFFFAMLIFGICMLNLLKNYEWIKMIVPLIIVIAITDCNTADRTYKNSNIRNWNYESAYNIANDIIDQVKDAEKQGLDSVDIYIPVFDADTEDNWPYSINATTNISTCLYKYGITAYNVNITKLIPVEYKNIELHVSR